MTSPDDQDRAQAAAEAFERLSRTLDRHFEASNAARTASAAQSSSPERRRACAQWLRLRDSCTIAEFANCLAGLEPAHWIGGAGANDAERSALFCAEVLTRSIGGSIVPVNPTESKKKHRFATADLLRTAHAKQLGYARELIEVLRTISAVHPPALIQAPAQLPAIESESDSRESRWRDMLGQMCAEIEQAAARGDLPAFDPAALPFSIKSLYAHLAERYRAAGYGEPPMKPDTFRKYLNESRGWKSKAGYQNPATARLLKKVLQR